MARVNLVPVIVTVKPKPILKELKEITPNHAPKAESFKLETDINKPIVIALRASDPDKRDSVSFSIKDQPKHGTLSPTIHAVDSWTYTPYRNSTTPDTFTYIATDNHGLSSEKGTVNVTINVPEERINSAPVAIAGSDQIVTVGDRVLLDGTRSYDPDSEPIISYDWRHTKGDYPVKLQGATNSHPDICGS